MKVRCQSRFSSRLVVPLATLVLLGVLWLAISAWPGDRVRQLPAIEMPAAGILLPRTMDTVAKTGIPPRRMPTPREAAWLPPLTDQTRTVLADCPDEPDTRDARPLSKPFLPRATGGLEEEGSRFSSVPPAETSVAPAQTSTSEAPTRLPTNPEADPLNRIVGPLLSPSPSDPQPAGPQLEAGDVADGGTGAPEPHSPSGVPPVPPESTHERSEQLELLAREADSHTRRGFKLAGTGALFAARAEFIKALRLVVQGLDVEHCTNDHSRALAAGLTAMKEAEDFIPGGLILEADLDLPAIIIGHRTPVLKHADARTLAPLEALHCYLTFSQEQLGTALGRELAGSMALRGLGKLHVAIAQREPDVIRAAESKAMVFYQAAMLVTPRNYMAANDLGVLLAKNERYADAQVVLEHSTSICRGPENLHNLKTVYEHLDEKMAARRVGRQWEKVRAAEATGRGGGSDFKRSPVRWVDPEEFAETYAMDRTATRRPAPVSNVKPPTPTADKDVARRWPWNVFQRRN